MLTKQPHSYKYPSRQCRVDEKFKNDYFQQIQNFYRFTDGVFNCAYVGKIFRISPKYARQIIRECPICREINDKRRYRRKYKGFQYFQLKQLVILEWLRDQDNVYIDDLALMWSIPVVSVQTILNKRPGATAEEHKLKRPLSFNTVEEFYTRNKWKDQDGNWTKPEKTLGYKLSTELQQQNRVAQSVPWASTRVINAVGRAFANGKNTDEIMKTYNIPDLRTFRYYVNLFSKMEVEKLNGTYVADHSMDYMRK